jgi:hypothetical protein
MHGHWFSLIPLLSVGVMLYLRLSRLGGGARRLRLDYLWIVPALLLVVTIFVFIHTPPQNATGWACALAALLAGGAAGWWRGAMMRITVDPATQQLKQQASPAAIVFLLAFIAIRVAARMFLDSGASRMLAAMLTDALIAFVMAMFVMQRTEMYMRGRRLLGGTIRPS